MQCAWMGMYLPVPSIGVQLTFLMNSPHDPVFNVCRWHGHFGIWKWDQLIGTPGAMLYASSSYKAIYPGEGRNQVE